MKGNISRDSHRPENRYSGVFQVQGGMVTDADLGEEARIARARADGVGEFAIRDGAPEKDGVVSLAEGKPRLVPGVVFADGVRGEVLATKEVSDQLDLYEAQVDFPRAPNRPGGETVLYADIWERTVSNFEDPLISDPGLHGAETALRQRTMAQLKWARAGEFFGPDGVTETAKLPRKGAGRLTVTPVDPETIADPCDPCADTVQADQTVANALFRIEVLEVEGDADAPDRIVLGWSAENASAIAHHPADPEAFGRAGAAYQFFSTETEAHLGVHVGGTAPTVPAYGKTVEQPDLGPANAPGGGKWPLLRRWDGIANVPFGGAVTSVAGGTPVKEASREVTLTVSAFTATIDFKGAPIVAGDYWLIEMRRFAETPIRVVSETPIGIEHHYCALFRVKSGEIQELTDQENRRLSFPTLADMPATHVSFTDECERFAGVENVHEALEALCEIPASTVSLDPETCPRLFDGADNVQDALANLCKVDFGNDRILRLLHDWGVVCGVIPFYLGQNKIRVSPGAVLHRGGRLVEIDDMSFDAESVNFLPRDGEKLDDLLRKDQLCLALQINDEGDVKPVYVSKTTAFAPEDKTMFTAFRDCIEELKPYQPPDSFKPNGEVQKKAVDKILVGASSEKLAEGQKLNGPEFQAAKAYNDKIIEGYLDHVGEAEERKLLERRLKRAEDEINPDGVSGAARQAKRMKLEAARQRIVQERNRQRMLECLCRALLPRCPEVVKAPYFVPIACVDGFTEGGRLIVQRLCLQCCRKQAMSWRMMNYYIAPLRERLAQRIDMFCCPDEENQPFLGEALNRGLTGAPTHKMAVRSPWSPLMLNAGDIADQFGDAFQRLNGMKSAADYTTRLEVDDLAEDDAVAFAKGNGVEVTGTIDVSDPDAVQKLREARGGEDVESIVAEGGKVRPGDKIALILRDGVAVDYIKVESGEGKLPFDRAAVLKDRSVSDGAVAVDAGKLAEADAVAKALEERVRLAREAAAEAEAELKTTIERRKSLTDELSRASGDLSALEGRREELARRVGEAETSLKDIRKERTELLTEVERAGGKLEELKAERETIIKATDDARAEMKKFVDEQKEVLAATRKERDAVVASIRKEAPVTSVVKDNEAMAKALSERGVTNVEGLAKMSDTELRAAASKARMNVLTARRLQREALERLARPVE